MKSQHELQSPILEGPVVLAEGPAEEWLPAREWKGGGLLPGGCDSELRLTGTQFSKRFLLETDNSDSPSYFSKEVIFKSTWEVPPPPSGGKAQRRESSVQPPSRP